MAKFWMWNNVREVINIEQITYIEVIQEDLDNEQTFAEVSVTDKRNVIELTREQYNSLIGFIKASCEYVNKTNT